MKKFRKVYIEITNVCNMHCSFCPETKRKKEFMSVKKFEYVLCQIKDYTDYVYLHVKGEPLLHPNISSILDICNKYNMKINISTNGVLLKEKMQDIENKNIRQMNISVHSFEKRDGLSNYLANVINSANILNKSGTIIRYKLWNDEVKDNKCVIEFLENRYNTKITKEDKDIKLKDNVYLSIKKPFVWPKEDNKNISGTCYGLRQQIAILVDGTVVPCCVDNDGTIKLGNIFKEDLESILNSKKAQDIVKGFQNGKCVESLCKSCTYKTHVT